MELIKGPFDENIEIRQKGLAQFVKKKNSFFIVDDFFESSELFKNCENVLFVKAGERLKSIKAFSKNCEFLISKGAKKNCTIYSVGGGSVGDSVGFLASVYLRGVKLVQVPTTWLSVVDSAIGGKTALNFMGSKNQIGTVYPPKSVLIFMDLLQTADFKMSEGEIIKTLVLNHKRSWAREVLLKKHLKSPDQELLKRLLTFKKMIVKKDPNDTNGVRALLNLGHSTGHAFESILGLSHSDAVKAGLKFSLEWSRKKRLINSRTFDELTGFLKEPLPLVSREDMLRELSNDKKSLFGGKLNFIFIDENGGIVKPVQIKSVVNEYQRQLQNGL